MTRKVTFHVTARRYFPKDLYNLKYDQQLAILATTKTTSILQVLVIMLIRMESA